MIRTGGVTYFLLAVAPFIVGYQADLITTGGAVQNPVTASIELDKTLRTVYSSSFRRCLCRSLIRSKAKVVIAILFGDNEYNSVFSHPIYIQGRNYRSALFSGESTKLTKLTNKVNGSACAQRNCKNIQTKLTTYLLSSSWEVSNNV